MTADVGDKMAVMNAWLDAVRAELGADRSVMDANTTGLLDLIRDVAHGPSRPGAPMTAFLVGWRARPRRWTPRCRHRRSLSASRP
jgi:hypothetical protein